MHTNSYRHTTEVLILHRALHTAAAAAALVAHQQQCIQLSLSRANAAAAEAG